MESYCSLCTLDTIHRLFFVTRLIFNKINKVQWVDFKLENVLVSLHSLKTMGLWPFRASAPLFLRNGELFGHSPIRSILPEYLNTLLSITHQVVTFQNMGLLFNYWLHIYPLYRYLSHKMLPLKSSITWRKTDYRILLCKSLMVKITLP